MQAIGKMDIEDDSRIENQSKDTNGLQNIRISLNFKAMLEFMQ